MSFRSYYGAYFIVSNPFYTRGISPFLTIFFLLLQLLLEFKNLDEIPSFQGSLCFYYAFGVYPIQQIVLIMILLYFIRYFSIIYLNQSKGTLYHEYLSKGKDPQQFEKLKIRVLKFFASAPLTVVVLVFSYLIIIGIFVIALASTAFVVNSPH
jgi:hypothetical protein